MPNNPNKHHRRSIRLTEYDYASPGAYSITICVRGHECILGSVVGGDMVLSEAGQVTEVQWRGLPRHYPHVELDAFVVMPHHVRGFKTFSARRINVMRGTRRQPFWQRNYYERVIRNERELAAIRDYIVQNPQNWELGREHPQHVTGPKGKG